MRSHHSTFTPDAGYGNPDDPHLAPTRKMHDPRPPADIVRPHMKAVLWDQSGGCCWYCGRLLNPFRDFTVDHVIAVARGGKNNIENLVAACKGCNVRKAGHSLEHFRKDMIRWLRIAMIYPDLRQEYFDSMAIPLPADGSFKFWFELRS